MKPILSKHKDIHTDQYVKRQNPKHIICTTSVLVKHITDSLYKFCYAFRIGLFSVPTSKYFNSWIFHENKIFISLSSCIIHNQFLYQKWLSSLKMFHVFIENVNTFIILKENGMVLSKDSGNNKHLPSSHAVVLFSSYRQFISFWWFVKL